MTKALQTLFDAWATFEAADRQYKSREIIQDEEPIPLRDRRPLDLLGAEWMARERAITALIEAVRQFAEESRK